MHLTYHPDQCRVKPGQNVTLNEWPTRVDPLYQHKKDYHSLLDEFKSEMFDLQKVLYAHGRWSQLVIFQGMDAAGKDGAIRHVMTGLNPQGVQVASFKQPSSEELDHDFLWRAWKRLPRRGNFGIFNRSYYEEVLIVRAMPSVLKAQLLPEVCRDREHLWAERMKDLVHFEDYLARNGTRTVKFFLHLSREEQRKRFLSRIDEADKNWKLSPSDVVARKQWDDYQEVYAHCLSHTSTEESPWYIVPADDKRNARLIISAIMIHHLQQLPMHYPEVSNEQRQRLHEVRSLLETPDS